MTNVFCFSVSILVFNWIVSWQISGVIFIKPQWSLTATRFFLFFMLSRPQNCSLINIQIEAEIQCEVSHFFTRSIRKQTGMQLIWIWNSVILDFKLCLHSFCLWTLCWYFIVFLSHRIFNNHIVTLSERVDLSQTITSQQILTPALFNYRQGSTFK